MTPDLLLFPTVTRPSVMLPALGPDFLSRAPFLISDMRADMSPPEVGGEDRVGLSSRAGGLDVGSGGGGGDCGDTSFGFCGGGGAGPLTAMRLTDV